MERMQSVGPSAARPPERGRKIFGLVGEPAGLLESMLDWGVMPLERALGLHHLDAIHERLSGEGDVDRWLDAALDALGVRGRHEAAELGRVRAEGAQVVVANHPFGGVEGLMLAQALRRRRRDVKIVANGILSRIEALRELFIFVDPWSRPTSRLRNGRALRAALAHLRAGGLLAVFPAGEVATRASDDAEVSDPPWQPSIARLIQRSQAPVLPVYFHGENSETFHRAGRVHPLLRTLLLPRELLNKGGRAIEMRVGAELTPRAVQKCRVEELAVLLKGRSEMLRFRSAAAPQSTTAQGLPLAAPIRRHVLEAELARLGERHHLLSQGEQRVFVASAAEIPNTLLEIGRLRQLAFRAAGEGTAAPRDLDGFDGSYRHLFVWHDRDREVVGAYRLGPVDELLEGEGPTSLYTSTLFDFSPAFFERLGSGLEMGRSFVQPRYQRGPTALMLLWRGIGEFVVRNPRYRHLFGPCSISADYEPLSRHLLVRHLSREHAAADWSRHVRPRNPLRHDRTLERALRRYDGQLRDIGDLNGWIANLERDQKRVPILLQHYLRLGGKVLGFNVDPDFSDVVDGLILVDLLDAPERTLRLFMGAAGHAAFERFHGHRAHDPPLVA
jgi:putative hemolysin